MGTPSTSCDPLIESLIDDDQILHPHLLVHEVAAMRVVRPGRRDKRDAAGLVTGQIDFTIDQQPYLQGFLPILQLYLYQASATLTGMADVNTGLKFLDKETVIPYNSTKSRYEGTSSSAGVTKS